MADPEPLPLTADACSTLARSLDDWARGSDDVRAPLSGLPKLDRHGAGHAAGLYVDDRRAPWMELGGELRFSLARLYSVTPRGVRLVAQIQVAARLYAEAADDAAGRGEARIEFYVHDEPGARAVESPEDLAREARERHDALAGEAAFRGEHDPAYL